ncbi:MAG: TonB-dependent receptor [Tenacibaculum sp.]
MNLKNIVLATLFLCLNTIANNQQCKYSFSGLLSDSYNKLPIEGALVFIKNQNKHTTSNIKGKFIFTNLCYGKTVIEIAHIGYKPKIIEINITGNTYRTINLEQHLEKLNKVSIRAKANLKTKAAQESLLKSKSLDNFSNASLGDAVKKISGVSSINTGNSLVKPVINGLHSSRVHISINNIGLEDQQWGVEHAPSVDVNIAESISLIKGANALQYSGDAIGGMIIVNRAKNHLKDSLYGKSIFTQQSNGRMFSVSSALYKNYASGVYINGQASYKKAGDFKAANYLLSNTGLQLKAFTIETGYKKHNKGFELFYSYLQSEIGILSGAHNGSVSDLLNALNSKQPLIVNKFSYNVNNPKQKLDHQLLKVSAYKYINEQTKIYIQYDYQENNRLEFDLRRVDKKNLPALDLLLKTHNFKADISLDKHRLKHFKFGLNAGYQNNFSNPATKQRRLIPDYDKYNLGMYAISELKIHKTLVNIGLRYNYEHVNAKKFYQKSRWKSLNYQQTFNHFIVDDQVSGSQILTNPVFNFSNFSTSIGITQKINTVSSLILNYGLANRNPNPAELFSDGLHQSASRIELGYLALQTETANRLSASYKLNSNKISLSLEGFYNCISNFIYLEPSGIETSLRGAFPVWSYRQTKANLFGLDIDLQYDINNFVLLSNTMSILKGKDMLNKRPLIDIPPFKVSNALIFKKIKWKNFYTKLESEFNTKQNAYPNNNFKVFIPAINNYELVDISSPPPAYHLLNFSTGFNLNMSKTKVNVQFFIDNILNKSYRNYLNRLRFFADDLGRNFKIQLKINY